MNDPNQRVERAIAQYLSSNRDYKGRAPAYHVSVSNAAPDGARFGLTLGLVSGHTYCCSEPGCHFGPVLKSQWARLREALDKQGLNPSASIHIEPFKWTIDVDVVLETPGAPRMVCTREHAHELGSILESEAKDL